MRGSRSPSRGPRRRASSVGACWGVATRRPLLSSGFSCFSVFLGRLLLSAAVMQAGSGWGSPRSGDTPPLFTALRGGGRRDTGEGQRGPRRGRHPQRPPSGSVLSSLQPSPDSGQKGAAPVSRLPGLPPLHPLAPSGGFAHLRRAWSCPAGPWPELRSPPCSLSLQAPPHVLQRFLLLFPFPVWAPLQEPSEKLGNLNVGTSVTSQSHTCDAEGTRTWGGSSVGRPLRNRVAAGRQGQCGFVPAASASSGRLQPRAGRRSFGSAAALARFRREGFVVL